MEIGNGTRTKKWSLYDITKDPTELNDLSVQFPDKVKALSDSWNNWAHQHHVIPKPK
ncbi:hypothetical protein [Niabella ginsengisoli]|uniref:N-sulphoglucosamine sulphohydrolase C-terminal domain-containing protein n=1 Tax=Niabella ginsengisoli TaxID=522298 RepID=A0ABS9SG84_9BACT|nr:hypothetical protein [Niabella ginsengisoli]MCH5597371.1 hypothetical protein [Niabella ginsengisoli]